MEEMNMKAKLHRWTVAGAALWIGLAALATTTEARPFTYQGELKQDGQPAVGDHDLRFRIFTSELGDIQLHVEYVDDQILTDGQFTAQIEAESIMTGFERWIEVAVRAGSVSNSDRSDASYTILSPRQMITPAPYATMAFSAKGLHLPIDEELNLLSGPALKITNGVNTAIAAYSTTGTGLRAESPSGFAIHGVSSSGWAGFFQGAIKTDTRLSIGYNNLTSLKLACNGDAAKPGGGSWSALSDRRFKENIRPLTGALDRLLLLRGYTFDYTPEALERGLALPGQQIGLIAQEVEGVFPEWVGEDEDGTKYVTERGTTALFVEALREMRAETDSLKKEVAELRALLGQASR